LGALPPSPCQRTDGPLESHHGGIFCKLCTVRRQQMSPATGRRRQQMSVGIASRAGARPAPTGRRGNKTLFLSVGATLVVARLYGYKTKAGNALQRGRPLMLFCSIVLFGGSNCRRALPAAGNAYSVGRPLMLFDSVVLFGRSNCLSALPGWRKARPYGKRALLRCPSVCRGDNGIEGNAALLRHP